MPLLTITHQEPGIKVFAEPPQAWQATTSNIITITLSVPDGDYLIWEDDPVLADLWDNDEDGAAFNDDV